MNIISASILIIIYLLSLGYLGFLGFKQTKGRKDYLIAGRTIHPYIMALSYGATFISTSAIIGFGGVSGLFGMGLMWLAAANIVIGILVAFIFFGKRTRQIGANLNAHTFPEFLTLRYNSKSIGIIVAIIIFSSMPLYSSVVLIGGARFLETVIGINFHTALLIFSVIIASYVIAGGLKGVMYTDALQGTIMLISMLFLIIFTYVHLGGITEAHTALTKLSHMVPEKLKAIGHLGWTAMPETGSRWWWTLITSLILGVGIGVLAQPQLIVRFMTVKTDKELNRAVLIGGLFILCTVAIIFMTGALTNVYFFNTKNVISITAAKGNIDNIIPLYIKNAMPGWFGYIFMLSLLSAAMSTLSSQFHTMGTSIGYDVIKFSKTNESKQLLVTRLSILAAIAVAVLLGYKLPHSIIARGTAIFFGICAASFLPAYIGAVFFKQATAKGALWSIICGFSISLFWLLFIHEKEAVALGICKLIFGKSFLINTFPWMVIDPIVIALPISFAVLIIVSKVSSKPDSAHINTCFHNI
jgi:SSS family solute:Na+ symporter